MRIHSIGNSRVITKFKLLLQSLARHNPRYDQSQNPELSLEIREFIRQPPATVEKQAKKTVVERVQGHF